jgi:hypothetical protein
VSFTFCHSRESGNPGKRLKKEVYYLLEKLLRHKKSNSYFLEMAIVVVFGVKHTKSLDFYEVLR